MLFPGVAHLIRTHCLKCGELREIEVMIGEDPGRVERPVACTRRTNGAMCRGELGEWPQFTENSFTTAAQAAAARLGIPAAGLRIHLTIRRRIRKRVYEAMRGSAGTIEGRDEVGRVIVRWDKGQTVHSPMSGFWDGVIPAESGPP